MSDQSKIEWTDATWNPVTGCTKVSLGCKHCYAEREWPRLTKLVPAYAGRDFADVRTHVDRLEQPLRWRKPRRVFVNSMSDLFHDSVDQRFIADVFGIMAACPQHTFQILTKRPARALELLGQGCMGRFQDDVEECLALYSASPLAWPLPNVWLGVSAENQETYDDRVELLRQTPAAVRWVSIEPIIGQIDARFTNGLVHGCDAADYRLDWVVVGGESGPNARPVHPQWARSLRDQCAAGGVPFLFKQWGEHLPAGQVDGNGDEWTPVGSRQKAVVNVDDGFRRIGKKLAGRLLDGVQHDEYPGVR
jgi:protein gp37